MNYQLSLWDEKGFVKLETLDHASDIVINHELNGGYTLEFQVSPKWDYYNLLKFRRIIRLHDLADKQISTSIIGLPGSNDISLLDGDGLELHDYVQVYSNTETAIEETGVHTLARAESYVNSAFTNETTEANDHTIGDMTLMGPALGDIYYYGDTLQFNVLTVEVSTIGIGDYDLVWEYYNGSAWVELQLDYNTIDEYRTEGEHYIAFSTPSDWAQATVDSQTYYWVRSRLSRVVTINQQATGTIAYIGWYGNNCKVQVSDSTNFSAGDWVKLSSTSDNGDVVETVEVISATSSPVHNIVVDVGHVHCRSGTVTTPGANIIGKITTLREADTLLNGGITAGSSVATVVDSSSGFYAGDSVYLHSGAQAEACIVESVDTTQQITLTTVANNHGDNARITNYSYTLSRLDITPAVNSKVDYVNFKTFRISEIYEEEDVVKIVCNHISYDLTNKYFSHYGKYDISYNPENNTNIIQDKVDIDTLLEHILITDIDVDNNPREYCSFIKGNLSSLAYTSGTVSIGNGSVTITGTNTRWLSNRITAGSTFVVEGDPTLYTISYVSDEDTLVLTGGIARLTATDLRYAIINQSVYAGDIYTTGTLTVVNGSPLITVTSGLFSTISAGAKLQVVSDDNIYYTLQTTSTTQIRLTKPIQRSSGSTLSYWIDKDRRELSFNNITLRRAIIELCNIFSDDEWVTWFEVNEDKSVDIIHRPIPFDADPTSSLVVRTGKNLREIKRKYDDFEFANSIIPLGQSSNWANAFSGITSAVVTDSRNSTTKLKLTTGDAKLFRAFDMIEILRYAQDITASTVDEKTFTIAPDQHCFQDDGGAFTDFSSEAEDESTRDDVELLPAAPATGDKFYFGADYKFSRIGLVLSTPGVGIWTVSWEYYNGSGWSTLTLAKQEIDDFTESSKEYLENLFSPPSDWSAFTVNSENQYWVKAEVTGYTSITTQPLAAAIYCGRFREDEYTNGRIVITGVTGVGQIRTIAFNDATTLTMTRKWDVLPYASTATIAAQYSNPIHVRGFGFERNVVSEGARLRRVECKYFNTITYGELTSTDGTTYIVDTTKNFDDLNVAVGDYIYCTDDINNTTQLSAWGIITSISTTTNPNDTINFSGGLAEGQNNSFHATLRKGYAVVDDAVTVRGAYRGGIISFLSGGKAGTALLWGNDDISFITEDQMESPLPHTNDRFEVVAPSQLVEQFDDDGTYPDYNSPPGSWVQLSSSTRYFQDDCYNNGRMYITDGARAGDYYTISDTTANTLVPSGGWGTQPADGSGLLAVKETDLPLSVAKHDFTPIDGDKVVLLLYETGQLTIGKYAEYRTYIDSGNVKLTKSIISVDDASNFTEGQKIFIGTQQITSDLIFGINRGSQGLGIIKTIDSISSNEITLQETLVDVPQPGDHVEQVSLANLESQYRYGIIEKVYPLDINDPRQLKFYGKKYLDKISIYPKPTYEIDILSLYEVNQVKYANDKYKIGDTIRVIDTNLKVDISTLRINKEVITVSTSSTVKIEVANPSIVTAYALHKDFIDNIEERLDRNDYLQRIGTMQANTPQCIYFYQGLCRKTFPPNTFCNSQESNRDGRLTQHGNPILKINCQAFEPIQAHNPGIKLSTGERYFAGGPDTFTIPVNAGEDDSEWHDLTIYDIADGVDFVVTDVHINESFYLTSAPTYTLPERDVFFEVRVKGTGATVLENGGVDNGHSIIQGSEDNTGFVVEYQCEADIAGTLKIEFWCWGYDA